MMFDSSSVALERRTKALAIGGIILWLGTVSTIIYVAVHFITKYW